MKMKVRCLTRGMRVRHFQSDYDVVRVKWACKYGRELTLKNPRETLKCYYDNDWEMDVIITKQLTIL